MPEPIEAFRHMSTWLVDASRNFARVVLIGVVSSRSIFTKSITGIVADRAERLEIGGSPRMN